MTVEPFEVAYLIIGSGGAFLTLFILGLRIGDMRDLYARRDENGKPINGFRRKLVWERLLSCLAWFTVNMLMLMAGVNALYRAPVEATPQIAAWRVLFFGIAIFSTALALYQGYIRLDTGPANRPERGGRA